MDLDRRSEAVLFCAVAAYLETGLPVSSATVARNLVGHRASAATVRNVMARLESAGLSQKPHASAGRAPTEAGLRAYLDRGIVPRLHPWDRTRLEASADAEEPGELASQLGQSLSMLASHMVVVAVPRVVGAGVREVGLVRAAPGRFIAYFVSAGGRVQQKLVELGFDLDESEVQRVQNYLNQRLRTRSLGEIRREIRSELQRKSRRRAQLKRRALELGIKALPDVEMQLVVEGASHLADEPELADLQKLHELLRAVEERRILLDMVDRILDEAGVRVVLASEHDLNEMRDLACVGSSAPGPEGADKAAITLLGPARMDYSRVVPLVGYATELLGRYWERLV